MPLVNWLEKNKDIGILLLRMFIGIRLVYGVADNVFSWHHMMAFEEFLDAKGFPIPLISAVLSVYAQFIAGILIITGFQIRIASCVMIVNFMIALVMVHRHDSFEVMTPALSMLFANLLFLFQGAGRFSL
jgi:putative oxidoreductase